MVRVLGALKVLLMAGVASCARQVVVVIAMAVCARARWDGVRTRQRKARLRVIELAIRPLHRVMALLAARRESRVRHGSGCMVEIVLVARNASRIRDGVVVVDVAIDARPWRHGVRSG